MVRYRLFILLIILTGGIFLMTSGTGKKESPPPAQFGGGCSYSRYTGTAQIIRIQQTGESGEQKEVIGGPGYSGWEVWFLFQPDEEIQEEWTLPRIGKPQLLQLDNAWYPGGKFLEKYGLIPDSKHPCTLSILTEGSCSPLYFEFDQIDTGDYFESASP